MSFVRVFTGAPWEKRVGYCRALRAGSWIAVTGTVAVDEEGKPVHPGDAEGQTARCLAIIEGALRKLGADRTSVIRTRMFVTDIARWEEIGRAHAAFFGDHVPTTTMVEVKALIAPEFLVEIEVDAVAE